jgi:hypothetical protein
MTEISSEKYIHDTIKKTDKMDLAKSEGQYQIRALAENDRFSSLEATTGLIYKSRLLAQGPPSGRTVPLTFRQLLLHTNSNANGYDAVSLDRCIPVTAILQQLPSRGDVRLSLATSLCRHFKATKRSMERTLMLLYRTFLIY